MNLEVYGSLNLDATYSYRAARLHTYVITPCLTLYREN